MTRRTMQAQNVARKVGVGFGGTEAQPRPYVHATFYKREDGAVLVAMVKGGVIELRPTDRVRVSDDPTEWANVRWCRSCEVHHPRYVTAGKTGAAYCAEAVRRSARTYRATKQARKSGATQEQQQAEAADRASRAVEAKLDRLSSYVPASREQMIATLLRNNRHNPTRFAKLAGDYRLTVEDATALITEAPAVLAVAS